MEKKTNWQEYKAILEQHGIKKLYHFTDRDNLESIIRNGGLYSWADCDSKGIKIEKQVEVKYPKLWIYEMDCRILYV